VTASIRQALGSTSGVTASMRRALDSTAGVNASIHRALTSTSRANTAIRQAQCSASRVNTLIVREPASIPQVYDGHAHTFGAAIVVGTGESVGELVPVPRRLQGKALSGNLLWGVMGESATRLFTALSGSSEIYRLNSSGRVLDSLRLPPALFPELVLPELRDWRETPNAMQQFMQAHSWIEALQPLNDSTLVVQVLNAAAVGEETTREFILVSWGARPRASSSAPCRCRIVGGRGGELALLEADSTGAAPRIEFRRLAGEASTLKTFISAVHDP
jgi:hypothetical protein